MSTSVPDEVRAVLRESAVVVWEQIRRTRYGDSAPEAFESMVAAFEEAWQLGTAYRAEPPPSTPTPVWASGIVPICDRIHCALVLGHDGPCMCRV